MSRGSSATSQESVQAARKKLVKYLRTLDTIPEKEVRKSAAIIKANAIALVPYKTGKLERSIYARPSSNPKRYGIVAGASARSPQGYDYAGIQHENESFQHPVKGQAHFISEPFEKEIEFLKKRLREELEFPDDG